MRAVCDRVGVHPDAPPDPTTFFLSFDRYAIYICRALLRISAQQHPQSDHVALNSTFFERDRIVRSVNATNLTNTDSFAVLDMHYFIERKHDTKTVPQFIRVPADDLRAVAADNGFQDWHTEYEIATLYIEYIVHHRGPTAKATANNPLIRTKGYKGWIAETSYSTGQRTRTPHCVHESGTDSFVRSFSYLRSTISRNSPRHYDRTPIPSFQ
jgi:hypothetical protein